MDSGQSALIVAAGCFIVGRRTDFAPGRHMPNAYVQYELAAPTRMVRILLAHEANVNHTDVHGRTSLMMAAMHGWSDVIQELVAAHAAVNATDHDGRLAIDYADPVDSATIRLLKKAGSRVPTGNSGRTVCDAERQLDKLGYDMPITDCIAGQQLRAVVLRYQREHSLSFTGELDLVTRTALGVR